MSDEQLAETTTTTDRGTDDTIFRNGTSTTPPFRPKMDLSILIILLAGYIGLLANLEVHVLWPYLVVTAVFIAIPLVWCIPNIRYHLRMRRLRREESTTRG